MKEMTPTQAQVCTHTHTHTHTHTVIFATFYPHCPPRVEWNVCW